MGKLISWVRLTRVKGSRDLPSSSKKKRGQCSTTSKKNMDAKLERENSVRAEVVCF